MPSTVEKQPQLLTSSQKVDLTDKLNDLRLDNERYLRKHPEIRHILGYLLRHLLHDRPDQVPEYIANLLTEDDLQEKVDADETAQKELHKWHEQMLRKRDEANSTH